LQLIDIISIIDFSEKGMSLALIIEEALGRGNPAAADTSLLSERCPPRLKMGRFE
jgi:hypothetical protein